jgi:hypothetical protein
MVVKKSKSQRPAHASAINLIQDAKSYLKAAVVVNQADKRSFFSPPSYFLVCHAIELALKAFLAAHGTSERTLRRKLGHNLLGLYEAALKYDFKPADDDFSELVDWLHPYHQEHVFRYRPSDDELILLPAPTYVAELLEPIFGHIECVVRTKHAGFKQNSS